MVPTTRRSTSLWVEIALAAPDKVTLAWLWNHVPVGWWWALVAAFITVFGLGVSVGQSEFYSRITTPAKATAARAESGKVDLGLGSANADRFVNYLKTVPEPRERIRLGCAAADERACVLAGQLLDLFNRAGWTVLGDKVERVQLGKPTRAIVLFKRGEGDKPVAKGSGVWVAQTPSLQVLQGAFIAVGLVPEAAADATMPEGTIGVYVGPL